MRRFHKEMRDLIKKWGEIRYTRGYNTIIIIHIMRYGAKGEIGYDDKQ